PAVRKLAREKGVDLAGVQGSGTGGRITKKDLESTSEPMAAPKAPATPTVGQAEIPQSLPMPSGRPSAFKPPPYRPTPGDEVVPFTRRRRIIADHMVYSKQTSPDVVTFAECDLDATSRLREQHKNQYKKEGVSLTFLSF